MDRQKEYKSENKMKDCLAYFHLSPVWEKVLKGFREKYISYGRFGGKVILKNLKPTDIEELEGFFGKSFHSQKSVTVSSEKFRQALETSRYKEITPECLLENFFEEPLLGRQEQKSLREQEKERIWEIFQRDYEGTPVETALESLRSIVKDNGSQELAKWDKMLRLGAEIYNNLPYRSTKMYLAVFAAMRTGNLYSIRITVNSIRNDGTTRKDPGNGGKPRKIKGFSELMKRGGARIDKFFEKRAHFSEQKEKLSTLSTKRAGKLHKQRVPGSFLNWNE